MFFMKKKTITGDTIVDTEMTIKFATYLLALAIDHMRKQVRVGKVNKDTYNNVVTFMYKNMLACAEKENNLSFTRKLLHSLYKEPHLFSFKLDLPDPHPLFKKVTQD